MHLGHSSLIFTEMLWTFFYLFYLWPYLQERKEKRGVDPTVTTYFILHPQDSAPVLA